jgi:hypothetical protein
MVDWSVHEINLNGDPWGSFINYFIF